MVDDVRTAASDDVLARFSPPVREWFRTTFATPTDAQARGWPAIADRQHTLLLAPTGSGKTLTAFLAAIDRLVSEPVPPKPERLRVIYLSPLRALAVDVDRNLRAPLEGIRLAAERAGERVHRPEVGVRTGDTPARDRERMKRTPPDVLITTPESLYLLLTSQARETLRHVETVIVDEIHAVAATKRGSHLALTLERLEREVTHGGLGEDDAPRPAPQRIALSATQRPLDELARFLGGFEPTAEGGLRPRPVTIVDAGSRKTLELEVVVPVEDLAELGTEVPASGGVLDGASGPAAAGPVRRSIWPAMHPRLLDLVLEHRSTLIFVNARRLAERLAAKLNELHAERTREAELRAQGLEGDELEAALADAAVGEQLVGGTVSAGPELVMAHHGSLSRERRLLIEDQLKSGQLRGLVATSSLELGIDMGAVDLVVQVSSPGAVSRGLQRIGRAGHQVGAPSRGVLFPKYRGDLVETAVVVRRMRDGLIESTRYPRNPLDVLAQHVVAAVAVDEWPVDDLLALVRRAAPFAELSEEVFHAVLDLLDGRYPSEEFSELRARIVWDRVAGTVRGRAGAQRLAVTNPGTIPDRGLFGVFLPDGARVGELDEEMVHESRPGETFVLGASTWRIEDITYDRVVVTPAPGQPGKLPFWHGDGPGRPYELGAAIGTFLREVREAAEDDRAAEVARLRDRHDLDAWAADNLVAYLEEQLEATGVLPDDRTVVVERFRDELGDWRICILSPFGAQVHAPWAMALERQLTDAGLDPEVMWADDGIVLRVQEAWDLYDGASADDDPFGADPFATASSAPAVVDQLLLDPDEVERLVVEQLAGTALFTTTFREAAGRALLLPKRRPGQRTALWQQRQRASDLLGVASRYPTFPMLLEATREILQDVFDLPALRDLLADLRARRVRVVTVDTPSASPFAQSLLFGWVGQYMYEYDAPLAERRAAALALDADLLRELLGGDELRELLDGDVLDAMERELQRLAPPPELAAPRGGGETVEEAATRHAASDRRARDVDELHDVLRAVGDLTTDELAARATADPSDWIAQLLAERRAIEVRVGGEVRLAAAEDAARLRDAIGVALPPGLPQTFTDPVDDPLADLVGRFARTHGPFTVHACAARLHVPAERVEATLRHLERGGRVLPGEFRPGGAGREWVDAEVLRRAKRRSLAALRREVEPVEPAALGRFLPAWHGVRGAAGVGVRRGLDALVDVVAQLQGAPIPASVLETDVLPARLEGYRPGDLDELIASGEVVWLGVEPLGVRDGRVVLCFREQVPVLAPLLGATDGSIAPRDGAERATHDALLAHLAGRGASFWPPLRAATGPEADPQLALDALWDLVWEGRVTNDTYQPVRDLVGGGRGAGGGSRAGRGRPGRLGRGGPPSARGRWSLTEELYTPTDDALGDTRRAHALAEQLLTRHGVLTREAMRVEAVRGGYATVYPVLKALEEAGRIRRGYVVAGLGAAQFAAPGAIDRLRGLRAPVGEPDAAAPTETVVLAATDPAQPYGAALAWPETSGRPARAAGAFVVLVDGEPAVALERSGRSLTTFRAAEDVSRWGPALRGLVDRRRLRKLEIVKVDGVPVHETPWPERLVAAGFTPGYRGLTYRGPTTQPVARR
jgi:ATP-dependent helicase Lhr and Lhr-like helicase